jgi:hypothetical protein
MLFVKNQCKDAKQNSAATTFASGLLSPNDRSVYKLFKTA